MHREERLVRITSGPVILEGNLTVPESAGGVVLFAHGSGSSRFSSRNKYVAGVLNRAQLATLLVDLLTADEEAVDQQARHLRFDVGLLSTRLLAAAAWVAQNPATEPLRIGYFGASTGAAAAHIAAVERPELVEAIVSRGGRPDLAGNVVLAAVQAPTLLIIGEADTPVLELNRVAFDRLRCPKRLVIVPGATHLFEEPGALDQVAQVAREWFEIHLLPPSV